MLSERAEAGDGAADDQGLDRVGALVGVDGLNVGVVTCDVVVQQDPVSAEDIAGHRAYPAGRCGGVQLGQGGVLQAGPPLGLELGQAHAELLHAGDVGQHVGQLVLDQLETRQRTAELLAPQRVRQRRFVRRDRVSERLPDGLAGLGQQPAGVGE